MNILCVYLCFELYTPSAYLCECFLYPVEAAGKCSVQRKYFHSKGYSFLQIQNFFTRQIHHENTNFLTSSFSFCLRSVVGITNLLIYECLDMNQCELLSHTYWTLDIPGSYEHFQFTIPNEKLFYPDFLLQRAV